VAKKRKGPGPSRPGPKPERRPGKPGGKPSGKSKPRPGGKPGGGRPADRSRARSHDRSHDRSHGGDLSLVATCGLGLEELLEAELREIGARDVRRRRAAVTFAGPWKDAYRANYRLRTANRVLLDLGTWDAPDGDALARGASELVSGSREWGGLRAEALFRPERSFAVRATSSRSALRDGRWVALRVKDGIVDAQRRRFGERATVEKGDPDLQLRLFLHEDRATLLLDLSGDSLDRRGYRVVPGSAPVREQIAAACVLASGWPAGEGGAGAVVVDSMCGSGTLLAEAAAYALGLAPGRLRTDWAFERLPAFDRAAWDEVKREAIPAPAPDVRLFGNDRAPEAIRAAEENLERAGLADRVTLRTGDAFDFEPPSAGESGEGRPALFLLNPPYGERIALEDDLWPRLGDLLKQRYAGYRAAILAGIPEKGSDPTKRLGLRTERRVPVKSGPLDARILLLDLY
jgi:23S rRNA (guanine2445-N2)-methyltransferase / 23S rRNA (guanine2069-N7)-methyltransferase